MNRQNSKMDLLGSTPIPKALMALGVPIMIGMLINALYNLVDAYFVGGLGERQMDMVTRRLQEWVQLQGLHLCVLWLCLVF